MQHVLVTAVAEPVLHFVVQGPGAEALVYPDGSFDVIRQDRSDRVTEAVYRALAEWYALDHDQFDSMNAQKVFREIR